MIETVLRTIEENNMFNKKDKVVVAVSGGPDSMCLLHILNDLSDRLNITLYAAHVNHCLRGKEADEDEEFVRNFCRSINVEFRCKRADINKISKNENLSCESAGRKVRYEFFNEVKQKVGANKIAIAHNANDQAETILMRIMRGTGLEGIVGIKAVRNNTFVRPLINNTRYEIEQYCKENKLNPRIDKTNYEPIYSRNKVRLQLIPYIQKNFNQDIVKTLNRLATTVKIDNDYLNSISEEKFKKYCDTTEGKVIISKEVFVENEAIISRILRLSLKKISGNLCGFERKHILNIIDIQKCSTGKKIMLPNNVLIENNYGNIVVERNIKEHKILNVKYILHEGNNIIHHYKCSIYLKLYHGNNVEGKRSNRLLQYFDYDKIKGDIVLRHRKEGDKLIPLGMKGSKKLKSLFIDMKIPKAKRENIPLICFGEDIGWVVGYRISELFKVDKHTENILAISFGSEES